MSDLISRKQAIDAFMKYNGYGSVWACIMGDIKQLPSVTIKDTADKIKVTNCNDNISRQAICDALDIVFADRIKSAGFDSYETADRDTQLVCDGIMRAIDVVLGQPTVDHLAEVSKKGDLISREDALSCFHDWIDSHGDVHTADEMPEYQRIEQLPSARPGHKNGKWNTYYRGDCNFSYSCNQCGYSAPYQMIGGEVFQKKWNFCPNCGADMRGEQDG